MSRGLEDLESGDRVAVEHTSNFNEDVRKTVIGAVDESAPGPGRLFFTGVDGTAWELDHEGQLIRLEDDGTTDVKYGVDSELYTLEPVSMEQTNEPVETE